MSIWDLYTIGMSLAGLFFFAAGTLGLLRFPSTYSRLHALTKADNLGLGLISLSLLPHVASVFDAIQLVIIWILAMISSAVASFLVASYCLSRSPTQQSHFQVNAGKSNEY